MDALLRWNDAIGSWDLVVQDGGIVPDDSLAAALLVSIGTEARAPDDWPLPVGETDRRGWFGEAFLPAFERPFGSLDWTLAKRLKNEATLREVRESAERALKWLMAKQIAERVVVRASWEGDALVREIDVFQPGETLPARYRVLWDALE
jgi:phage gp46-like protein